MSENAIEINGVRKTFGQKVAVENLDLAIPRGSLLGFIGPNGAGKTTTIRMIMSILFPDHGELSVLGKNSAVESKDRIGYLPEERGVYKKMKVGAFLKYMARLKGVSSVGLDTKVVDWLKKVQLPGVTNKKCEELSKGMQQKVQFIASVIHEPELVILDEPFSGLDPVNMRLLRELIREQHEMGRTVIFSTHVMAQAEQVCEKIAMIHHGHKMLDGTIAEIKAQAETRAVLFDTLDPNDTETPAVVRSWRGIQSVEHTERGWEASIHEHDADPVGILRGMAAELPISRVELKRPTLEDIFIEIVGRSATSREEAERLREQLREGAATEDESAEEVTQ